MLAPLDEWLFLADERSFLAELMKCLAKRTKSKCNRYCENINRIFTFRPPYIRSVNTRSNFGLSGADPGFLNRGFKCRKRGFVCLISHENEIIWVQIGGGGGLKNEPLKPPLNLPLSIYRNVLIDFSIYNSYAVLPSFWLLYMFHETVYFESQEIKDVFDIKSCQSRVM